MELRGVDLEEVGAGLGIRGVEGAEVDFKVCGVFGGLKVLGGHVLDGFGVLEFLKFLL